MNEFQAWKKFITTGKIKDYIEYKNVNDNAFTDKIKGVGSINEYQNRRSGTKGSTEGQAENTNTFN